MSSEAGLAIDTLHEWRLNVNKNAVRQRKLVFMFPDKGFFPLMLGLRCISIVI